MWWSIAASVAAGVFVGQVAFLYFRDFRQSIDSRRKRDGERQVRAQIILDAHREALARWGLPDHAKWDGDWSEDAKRDFWNTTSRIATERGYVDMAADAERRAAGQRPLKGPGEVP